MNRPDKNGEEPIDLESSSQIELGRAPGCDADTQIIDPAADSAVPEPHHRRTSPLRRELLANRFPEEA